MIFRAGSLRGFDLACLFTSIGGWGLSYDWLEPCDELLHRYYVLYCPAAYCGSSPYMEMFVKTNPVLTSSFLFVFIHYK